MFTTYTGSRHDGRAAEVKVDPSYTLQSPASAACTYMRNTSRRSLHAEIKAACPDTSSHLATDGRLSMDSCAWSFDSGGPICRTPLYCSSINYTRECRPRVIDQL